MTLISITNSGESLEKTIALMYTSYLSNIDFYKNEEKIIVCYDSNLKKEKSLLYPHGTVGSLIFNHKDRKWNILKDGYLSLQKNQKQIIEQLLHTNYISKRTSIKLMNNNKKYIEFILNMPFDIIFPEFSNTIIKKFENLFHNVKIVKLNLKLLINNDKNFIITNRFDSKIYFLTANSEFGNIDFCGCSILDILHKLKFIENCPIISGNVYTFIQNILEYAKNIKYPVIGYRQMKRFPRKAYNNAIKKIIDSKVETLEEPKNTIISKIFDETKNEIPNNSYVNVAICKAFDEFCNKYL